MNTKHKVIFGNSMSMEELGDESVHLIVTSPPYFNAPFDYKDLFDNYEQYLGVLKKVAKESFRVLKEGRIFALNIDDMFVDNKEYIPSPVLNLTSTQLKGNISSKSSSKQIKEFIHNNSFTDKQTDLVLALIEEAKENNFILEINKFE